jgi:hypothetical protein
MTQKTAVGGFDGDDWSRILAVMAGLVALGVLPKSLRPVVGTASTALAAYTIAKKLGWL